jgi:hypothetical protein
VRYMVHVQQSDAQRFCMSGLLHLEKLTVRPGLSAVRLRGEVSMVIFGYFRKIYRLCLYC